MLRAVKHMAQSLAHKHPLVNAVLVAAGVIAVGDVALRAVKPKPSTDQSVAKAGG
jgi:hypothetical protein